MLRIGGDSNRLKPTEQVVRDPENNVSTPQPQGVTVDAREWTEEDPFPAEQVLATDAEGKAESDGIKPGPSVMDPVVRQFLREYSDNEINILTKKGIPFSLKC